MKKITLDAARLAEAEARASFLAASDEATRLDEQARIARREMFRRLASLMAANKTAIDLAEKEAR